MLDKYSIKDTTFDEKNIITNLMYGIFIMQTPSSISYD